MRGSTLFIPTPAQSGGGGTYPTIAYETEAFPVTNASVTIGSLAANGVVAGDLCVVACVANDLQNGALPTANGNAFTSLDVSTSDGTLDGFIAARTLLSGDVTAGVVLSGDASFNGKRYQIWFLHSTGGPTIDGTAHSITQGSDASTNTIPIPGITTATLNTMLLVFGGCRGATGTAHTGASGFTADQDNPGGFMSMWAGHKQQAAIATVSGLTIVDAGTSPMHYVSGAIAVKA